jgi:hypothetical protein
LPFVPGFICFFIALTCAAQQEKLITLSAHKTPLQLVLKELTEKYQLYFAYSSNQIDLEQKITVELNNVPLEAALKKILNNTGISYSINGSQIVLFKDPNQRYTISGRIREKGSGELLIGVIVSTNPVRAGAVSNEYGFYSITLPADTYTVQFNYLGFKPFVKTMFIGGSNVMDIELEAASKLDEVVVTDDAVQKEHSLNTIQVPLKEIGEVPMILGEKDVLKYAMLMPGLQKGNEGNSYMYVRGGGPDQNLILVDDAIIYNAYHYLGLSSLFTGTELRNAELIKSGFSSKYGGRLSSVVNMSIRDGNRERMGAEATLGVISSKLMVEGPIVKNKSSFFISARRSYIDKVSKILVADGAEELNYSYYDLHAKLSTDIGTRDRLMLSGYMGQDKLITDPTVPEKDDGISWGNRAATLRWNHQYSGRLFSNTSLVYSFYKSRVAFVGSNSGGGAAYSALQSEINDYTIKHDLDYVFSGFQRIKAGLGYTSHHFKPLTSYREEATSAPVNKIKDDSYYAGEAFAYAEYTLQPIVRLKIVSGVRMSHYTNQVSYTRAEPRLNITYKLKRNWSVNASYDMMNQYVHLISTFSGFGFPSDIWTGSDNLLKPQHGQVVSAGIYKNNIKNSQISFAIEGYYKYITHMAIMKDGASFFQLLPISGTQEPQVEQWNALLTSGNCTSYGTEMQLKKEGKRFSGWISYTLSKTTIDAELVNRGDPYPATYDRRHDLGIYASYKTAKHFMFSANWVYGTGNAISMPSGEFFVTREAEPGNAQTLMKMYDYESKNGYRMRSYHRLDISIQYKHLIAKKVQSTIEFSVYNVYNRANPFFYQIANKYDGPSAPRVIKQTSLFPVMPSVSWTIKI